MHREPDDDDVRLDRPEDADPLPAQHVAPALDYNDLPSFKLEAQIKGRLSRLGSSSQQRI
jgi:hypothetical protein